MGYVDKFVRIKEIAGDVIEIYSPKEINQNGVYLYFDGVKSLNILEDILNFSIIAAHNSYVGDGGVLGVVEDIRKRFLECIDEDIVFNNISNVSIEGSILYMARVSFSAKIEV